MPRSPWLLKQRPSRRVHRRRERVDHRGRRPVEHLGMRSATETPGLRLMLNADEAAAELRVSTRTVRSLIARGELPIVRIGTRVLLPRDALTKWVHDRTSEAAS